MLVPIFQEQGEILIQRWKKYSENGEAVEIVHDLAKATSVLTNFIVLYFVKSLLITMVGCDWGFGIWIPIELTNKQ